MSTALFSSTYSPWVAGSLPLSLLQADVVLGRGEWEGYRVVRIEHYKEKTPIGHEFHALYLIKDNDSSVTIILRIERRPGAPKGASSTAVVTDDSITRLDRSFEYAGKMTFYHISTTICKQTPALTVPILCDICAYILDAAPFYNLRDSKHCYWFCTAFLIRLRTLGFVEGDTEQGEHSDRKGRFRGWRVITEESVEKDLDARALGQSSRTMLPIFPFRRLLSKLFKSKQNIQHWEQVQILDGHAAAVMSVCFTPEGRDLISGSGDHTVRIWDATTGRKVQPPLKGHTGEVNSVAVSPDGRRIASASDDQTVRIWDLETGAPVTEPLRGHTFWVQSVAFSPDGRKIVSGSDDESVRIWDVETGAAVGEPLRGHSNLVRSVAWSPDGSRIVSGSGDHTIRAWDAQTGTPVGEPLRGHTRTVHSMAFSPDGSRLVSGSDDKTVRLWDIASQRALGEPLRGHTSWVSSVAFSPDGCWIASGSYDETVRIWDSASGGAAGEVAKLEAGSRVWSVAWMPAGDRVAAGCRDAKIRMWRKVAS